MTGGGETRGGRGRKKKGKRGMKEGREIIGEDKGKRMERGRREEGEERKRGGERKRDEGE